MMQGLQGGFLWVFDQKNLDLWQNQPAKEAICRSFLNILDIKMI